MSIEAARTDEAKPARPARRRHWRGRRPPAGSAPGTLVQPLEAKPPTIHMIAYGPDRIVERTLRAVDEAAGAAEPVTWIDVQGLGDLDALRALGRRFGLHPLALADVAHVNQRPKLEAYDAHLFVVLRMPHLNGQLWSEQLSLVVGRDFVITFQERAGDCFDTVRQRLRQSQGRIRAAGADYLAYALVDALIDSFFPVLEHYGERVEQLEQDVLREPDVRHVNAIHNLKRDLLELRRAIWPLREVVGALVRGDVPFIQPETRLYFRDCADHVFQLMDMVEIDREVASGLVDLHLSSVSMRMNEIMKVLTVIATIFIPLSFIAGVWGMNFDPAASPLNMPELQWYFGYPMALGLMLAVALALLFWFRRKRWIGR